jgi:hypothetical protein
MPGELEREQGDEQETTEGVGIRRARDILGDLVSRAGYGNERIPIIRHGKQTAFLIGPKDAERLRQLDTAAV